MEKEFILEGLGCANCAKKMERKIRLIDGIKKANIDFVNKNLTIEQRSNLDDKEILEKITKIVQSIEPHVNVIVKSKETNITESNINKSKLIELGISTILFFTVLIFDFKFNIEITFYLISYLLVGRKVLLSALRNISKGQVFDENFLMTIATIAAFIIKEYPEAVAVMLFYNIGMIFEDLAVNRSRKSIKSLLNIRPDFANLKTDQTILRVSPDNVKIGDTIVIKPGERVPLDGEVISGESMIDTSVLTGESLPRKVVKGDEVLSGSINQNGLLTVKVTKEFSESTVSKILELVQKASSKKAPTEKFITKFARYYTPVVVFLALFIAILPPIILKESLAEWIYRASIFLVVSCPCALVISIPLGFFGGIGGASKNGILVKGGSYLEALTNVDTIVFDKTGTLTKGIFKVTNIQTLGSLTERELLKYAAYAESYSNHPIAISILKAYDDEINEKLVKDYKEISGQGIKAIIEDREILIGNSKLMTINEIDFNTVDVDGTVAYVAIDGNFEGYIVISDELKTDTSKGISKLKKLGIKNLSMLTGDNKLVAEKIGEKLGIDKVFAELLPHEKVEKFELIQKNKKGNTIFVGDGINDAPVLARSDIGIAMGGLGSDAAIEAADVVIMTDEISKLADAIKISKKTKKIVWQNIVFALGIKILVLILGALGMATMWAAVFADVGVAVIAILNSIRATFIKD
ncbi:heavy metal translocating P-type ATPase [Thermohalobacter berrensis]|uniref:Cadmium-translocating P-type ATPase n=1 Tax=Thermohalobacter berrensis TaxID=99594 RepID=A0A419SXW5_9FIRM|nr:heavy metal translocating P-type ATPase [Thermohalobacter berrensis]RKD30048.1 cadmium-translocating P-type ATPase [Thermohalobacter berrensis]